MAEPKSRRSGTGMAQPKSRRSGTGMAQPNPAFLEFPIWPTPPNSLPANHRGHLPPPNSTLARVTAHGRTNLLHRGHTSPPQPPVTTVTAHGEMQELVKGCRRPQENYSPRGSRQSADNPQTTHRQSGGKISPIHHPDYLM